MSNNKVIEIKNPELKSNDLLTNLIRDSAREMLAHAIELELQDFLTKHSDLLANNNKPRIVRNGYLPRRKITTGIGSIDVKLPRVRDGSDSEVCDSGTSFQFLIANSYCFLVFTSSLNLIPLITSANRLNPYNFFQRFSASRHNLNTIVNMALLQKYLKISSPSI